MARATTHETLPRRDLPGSIRNALAACNMQLDSLLEPFQMQSLYTFMAGRNMVQLLDV